MTGAEGVGSASSAYFAQQIQQVRSRPVAGLTGGEGAGAATSSSVSISNAGQIVSGLAQLQSQSPGQFQQVVSQMASQLQTSAAQQGQSSTGQLLAQLANTFQNVANGGALS